MTDTVQAIARSLSADVQTLSAISQNVANINTPAFRGVRAVPSFEAATGVRAGIDQRDGALMVTGRNLDVALRGPGFFVVERAGKALLTRAGALRISPDGALVTVQGDRVAGVLGNLVGLEDRIRIDAHGQLWVGSESVGALQITAVAEPSRLRPAGAGAYYYDGEEVEWKGSVLQGALERANVDPAEETIRLIETTRHAESVQRAISIYDKVLDTGINRLGTD